MTQPYGLGTGVAPPPGPPPAPPQWQPGSFPPPPAPPRRRRVWPALAVAGALLATAVVAGGAGALMVRGSDAPAAPPAPSSALPPAADPAAPADVMCSTLESEYPGIVAAINDRNVYDAAPWTDPGLVASSERLARVTWASASEIEQSIGEGLPPSYAKAGIDYVTALRAMSISESNKAVAKQLNGVASLYNSVVDPILAVCGIEG